MYGSAREGTFDIAPTGGGGQRSVAVRPVAVEGESRLLRNLLVGLDFAALSVAWGVAAINARELPMSVATTAALVAGGLVVFSALGLYRARVCSLRTVEYSRLARGCVLLAVFSLALAAITGSIESPRRIVLGAALTFVVAVMARAGYRTWLSDCRRAGRHLRTVLLVGGGDEATEIGALLGDHPELGYRTAGIAGGMCGPEGRGPDGLWHGDLSHVVAGLTETGATGAIICANDLPSSQLNRIAQELLNAGAHLQLSTGLHGVDVNRLRPAPLAHEPLFYVEPIGLVSWQRLAKRTIDCFLSGVLLVLSAPVVGLAALCIVIADRGPVLFRQVRVGRDGKSFVLYKLRTMRVDAEREAANLIALNVREGPLFKLPHDPRVTKLGRILRATSIDELPQIWNVLNGTMSLVGPRPALPDEVSKFDDELRARESVRPGITGLWQVEGRDNPSFAAYRRFDLFYVHNWHIALDLMILLWTIESVVARTVRSLRHPGQELVLAPPEVAFRTNGFHGSTPRSEDAPRFRASLAQASTESGA